MIKASSVVHYAQSSLAALLKSPSVPSRPVVLTIEPTNVCNLRCPVCETGAGILRRPKGMMSLDDFKRILDNVGGQVNQILLYFMGESFLNKQIYDMIVEAKRRKIYVSACTNGEFVDGKRLVESGIDEISFQIGGLTQETHEKYRVGGNIAATFQHLLDTTQARDSKHSPALGSDCRHLHPKTINGLIVMRHNEHQVPEFLRESGKQGIISEIINPCVRTVEQARELLPANRKYWIYDEAALNQGILRPKTIPSRCWWIYYSTVVCWNGDIVPCCRDAHEDWVMGNVLRDDFGDIWNGEKYRRFRKLVATGIGNVKVCSLCSGFGVPRLK